MIIANVNIIEVCRGYSPTSYSPGSNVWFCITICKATGSSIMSISGFSISSARIHPLSSSQCHPMISHTFVVGPLFPNGLLTSIAGLYLSLESIKMEILKLRSVIIFMCSGFNLKLGISTYLRFIPLTVCFLLFPINLPLPFEPPNMKADIFPPDGFCVAGLKSADVFSSIGCNDGVSGLY